MPRVNFRLEWTTKNFTVSGFDFISYRIIVIGEVDVILMDVRNLHDILKPDTIENTQTEAKVEIIFSQAYRARRLEWRR